MLCTCAFIVKYCNHLNCDIHVHVHSICNSHSVIQEAGHLVGAGLITQRRGVGEGEGEGEREREEEEGLVASRVAVRTVSPCLWPVLMLAGSLVPDAYMYIP